MDSTKVQTVIKDNTTIIELSEALDSGSITSRELVLHYLKRISEYDKSGPGINSVLEINPDALYCAEAMDKERNKLRNRGLLYGIPILLKDNINTGDKMHTSAGSLSLAGSYAAEDAFIVKKLRAAGAIILGKTNMTEFANFMTENMPNGYSSRGGQVLNPYGPGKFDVSGSSSGSAAAVAAGFCAAAMGTETSGSILSPASINSIVGIKPTVGLVSRSGIIPIAHSQDTAGPMARTVADAALLLQVISGYDVDDAATHQIKNNRSSYMQGLDKNGLQDVRIGVPRDYYYEEYGEEHLRLMENAISIIKALGAVIVDPADIKTARSFSDYNVLVYEFKPALNYYLSKLNQGSMKTLKDIIEFNNKNADTALKYGQTLLEKSESTSGTLTDPVYLNDRINDLHLSRTMGIDHTLDEYNLDALLFPGAAGADIAARAGYPSITVPAGYTSEGEPFGVTFTAKAFSESKLIKHAYAFEQAAKLRRAPEL